MKRARNVVPVLWVLVLTVASAAWGQVLKQVPASALAIIKVNNLDATNKKVADMATALGIAQMDPDLADPLGALLKKAGMTDGVNRSGDLAFAYIDPDVANTPEDKSMLVLIPVSDYQKFIGNFPDAATNGDVTTAHFKNSPDPAYIAHWGDFAAASPTQSIVATPPTDFISVAGLAAKELDGKDFVIYGNLKALRPKMLAAIDKARAKAPEEIEREFGPNSKMGTVDVSKLGPLAKVVADQLLDLAQKFANGSNAATISFNLSADGIATTWMCEFDADSECGKNIALMKNTDDSFLQGLAQGKYLMYGGAGKLDIDKPLTDFLTPIQAAITNLGPDYASVNTWLDSFQKIERAAEDQTFGMVAPTHPPGQGSMIEVIGIRRGDAHAIMDGMHAMEDAQATAMKTLNFQLPNTTQTYIPAAKTVDGVNFDEIKTDMTMNANTPGAMQMTQIMTMMYGPQGQAMFIGVVNDRTLLTEMGLDDPGISDAITAAKANDDPLAKNGPLQSVVAQLPAQRFAAFYLPLDIWASTGFGYAKQFGMDMGVNIPDNLPPIGTTFSTDGSAVRSDTYVPMQLMQALTAAGIQVYDKTQNPGGQPGAAPGGAAPGGL
jgi:hypothetical protein